MKRDLMSLQLNLGSELIIDNFAGGGGTSEGLEQAFGRPVDIAINHDPQALAMHAANHPHTKHMCESVWDVDPIKVTSNQPVSAGGQHHAEVRAFLLSYYGTDQAPQIDGPLATVTSRDRVGLVTIHGQDYRIVGIGLRMLMPRELFRAQGFPEHYIIGDNAAQGLQLTKSAQVRMCGNSLCPPMEKALIDANIAHEKQIASVAA